MKIKNKKRSACRGRKTRPSTFSFSSRAPFCLRDRAHAQLLLFLCLPPHGPSPPAHTRRTVSLCAAPRTGTTRAERFFFFLSLSPRQKRRMTAAAAIPPAIRGETFKCVGEGMCGRVGWRGGCVAMGTRVASERRSSHQNCRAPMRKGETYARPSSTLFRDNSKRHDVRVQNIEAAKAVADAVRTSLGPRGMDKMVSGEKKGGEERARRRARGKRAACVHSRAPPSTTRPSHWGRACGGIDRAHAGWRRRRCSPCDPMSSAHGKKRRQERPIGSPTRLRPLFSNPPPLFFFAPPPQVCQPNGEVVITNDGATILNKMTLTQPAAKMLVELAKSQVGGKERGEENGPPAAPPHHFSPPLFFFFFLI